MTTTIPALAAILGGEHYEQTLFVGSHHIECRPTGRIYLDRAFQLGSISDEPSLVAARYRAAVSGVEMSEGGAA